MKTGSIFLLCLLLCMFSTGVYSQVPLDDPNLSFEEIRKEQAAYWSEKIPGKGDGYKPYKRWEYHWEARLMPDGTFPPSDINRTNWNAYINKLSNAEGGPAQANWTSMGPTASPGGAAGMGRVNCIAFVPNAPNTIWVGTPAGGLWRSTDNGSTWMPMTDHLPFSGVTAIVVDPANPDRMFIATGDAFGQNVPSMGVWMSADGGLNWVPTGLVFNKPAQNFIRQLAIQPGSPNVLYAATNGGILRSADGGATWNQVQAGNFWDLRFHPINPGIVYAASNNAFFRSINSGQAWGLLQNIPNSGRIALAVTPDNPNLVMAVSSTPAGNFNGVFASTNNGANLTLRSDTPNILNNTPTGAAGTDGQGWYDLCIAISPTNANLVFVGGVNLWRSTNGGVGWNIINHWFQQLPGSTVVHADKHCLVWRPGTNELYQGNDGGIYRSNDNGAFWTDRSNGLVIGQLHRMASSTLDGRMLGGFQDNGTQLRNTAGTWDRQLGGDGMECHFHPTNPAIMYGCIQNGELRRTLNNWNTTTDIQDNIPGQPRGAWVTPYTLSPTDPNTLLAGYREVFRSNDQGDSWTQISNLNANADLTSLAVAPSNPDILYVATRNQMWRGEQVGGLWLWSGAGGIPVVNAFITSIAVDPVNPMRVLVTLGRYVDNGKVFVSDNGGFTWTNISDGLPNLPAHTIAFNPCSNAGMYLGMDIGVYYRDASMQAWVLFHNNLPLTPIQELEVHAPTSMLRAATFGRGVWQSPLWTDNQLAITPFQANVSTPSGARLFQVASDQNWTVTSNQPWLSVSPASGTGNGSFSASFLANTGADARTGIVTVTGGGGLIKMVSVTQSGTTPIAACVEDHELRNNDLRNPPRLELDQAVRSLIGNQHDHDYWRIDLPGRGNLTVTLTDLPVNYQLAVLNGAGVQLGSSNNAGIVNETVTLLNQPAGTYYALVQGVSGTFHATSCYTLQASAISWGCVNDFEPDNDTPTTAAPLLAMNSSITSQIGTGGDVDHWRFTVGSPIAKISPIAVPGPFSIKALPSLSFSSVVLTLSGLSDDYDLQLLNAQGQVVFVSALSGTSAERIEAKLLAGTYYARVSGPACGVAASGCYTLSLAQPAPAPTFCTDTFEPANNTMTTAPSMVLGEEYASQLQTSADYDFWRFQIPTSTDVLVALVHLHADLELLIYNNAGQVVGAAGNFVHGDESVHLPDLPAGTYFIRVFSAGTYNFALCYSLKVTTRAGGCHNDSEPANNSISGAPMIPVGTPITSRLESVDALDIWAFTAPVSMTNVRVTLSNLGVPANLVIRDRFGVIRGSATQGGATDKSVQVALPFGWYYAEVTRPAGVGATGCYTLLVEADAGIICTNDNETANNSPNTAPVIPLGRDVYSQIGSSTDRDWWRFALAMPSTVTLSLSNLQLDYTLMLRTATGILATSANAGTADESITMDLPAGIFFAYVEGAGGAWSTNFCYTLQVSARSSGSCANTHEPANNNRLGSPIIGFSTDVFSQIGTAGDQDFWRFDVNGNQVVVVELDVPASGNVNYDLQLQNVNGGVLATSSQPGSLSEGITLALNGGTHYLRVFSPNNTFTTAECYRLRVAVAPFPACTNNHEPANNSIATAPEVPMNAFLHSQLSSASSNDIWKFTVYQHGTVHLNLFNMTADYALYLMNRSGVVIGHSNQVGAGVPETFGANLGPGVYYAAVVSNVPFAASCYILEISDRPWVRFQDEGPLVARSEVDGPAQTALETVGSASIFPNPTTGRLRVLLPDGQACQLTLTDNLGRILEETTSCGAADLDLGFRPDGIFFLRIGYEDGRTEQKAVVKQGGR